MRNGSSYPERRSTTSFPQTRRDRMLRTIYIQQDGAKNHIHEDDEEFNNALMEQDIDTKLYMQTPNSPGVNLFDFGVLQGHSELQQCIAEE